MHILFLSRWFPYPPNNGAKIRILNLLEALSQNHQVSLISFYNPSEGLPQIDQMQLGSQVVGLVPWKEFEPGSLHSLMGFFDLKPRSFIDTFSSKMRDVIENVLSQKKIELIVASEIQMAAYVPYFDECPAVFDDLEIALLYEQYMEATSLENRFRYGLTWLKYRHFLPRLIRYFRTCTVVSDRERDLLTQVAPNYRSIEVIPNCVDLGTYRSSQEQPNQRNIIFTGSFTFYPNYEAMRWFTQEVFPAVKKFDPQITLTITGDHACLPLPSTENVHLTGFVKDIRPYIAQAWASIVPIFTGSGTRLKILEAMALGTPVVSTTKGAEGLEVEDHKHLLLADTPQAFAQATIKILRSADLRQRIAANARKLVAEKYDWAIVKPKFLQVIERSINS